MIHIRHFALAFGLAVMLLVASLACLGHAGIDAALALPIADGVREEPAGQPLAGQSQHPITLAATFASWYGYNPSNEYTGTECSTPDASSYHWTATGATGGVIDMPDLPEHPGYYCSSDPGIIDEQLRLIEQAGIQVLFVGWWGDAELEAPWQCVRSAYPDSHINEGIHALLDGIHRNHSPVKVALIVEPFIDSHECPITGTVAIEAASRDILTRLWTEYYGPNADLMFRWPDAQGVSHPLLITFDPMTLTMPVESPVTFTYTIKHWTGYARSITTTTEGWDWSFGPPQDTVTDGRSDDGVVFVYPRFDEYPEWEGGVITRTPRSINPLLRQCIYAQQWAEVIANRDAISMVVVYGWNLYGEQAYIEPAKATSLHPERPSIGSEYIMRTKAYSDALRAPEPVLPPFCRGYLPALRR